MRPFFAGIFRLAAWNLFWQDLRHSGIFGGVVVGETVGAASIPDPLRPRF